MTDTNDAAAASNGAGDHKKYDYGGNPLAREPTSQSNMLPAFGGAFQPGLYKQVKDQKIANPAPLGLSAFALTTFLLSLINIGVRGTMTPSIVIGAAFGYGGLIQLLAGMWCVIERENVLDPIDEQLTSGKGNGCWQYLWCDCTVVLRWLCRRSLSNILKRDGWLLTCFFSGSHLLLSSLLVALRLNPPTR